MEVLAPEKGSIQVFSCPHPFKVERNDLTLPAGLTVLEILARVQADPVLRRHAHIFVGDQYIPQDYWGQVKPKPGMTLTIRVVPSGGEGKDPLRTVLSIAIIAAAAFAGPAAAGALGLVKGSTAFSLVSAGITAAVGIGGQLLLNAIIPPSRPKLDTLTGTSKKSNSISGAGNFETPFGPIPVVLGEHRHFPPLGAKTYTEIVGDDQYFRMLLIWGYGPLDISNHKIGQTDINEFEDVEIETVQGFDSDPALTLFPDQVFEEALQITVHQVDDWILRTTQPDCDEISFDLTFPRGIQMEFGFLKFHPAALTEIEFEIETSPTGAGTWTQHPNLAVAANQVTLFRKGQRIKMPSRGQYDIRIRRITPDPTDVNLHPGVAMWTALRTFTNENPIQFHKPVAATALRIRATDQLSGVIDKYSATVKSIVKDWNGSAWVEQVSNNPSALARHVWQFPGDDSPLPDTRVDIPGLQAFHDYCVAKGFTFNIVVDFQSSVGEMVRDILAAGRASPTNRDGKWSVVIDQPQTTPCQMFTPRNMLKGSFSGKIVYSDKPHGFRVRFINEEKEFTQDERIVYDDGFDETNATKFATMEFTGVTNPEQIWKLARYHIATLRLRPEIYTFSADVENLVCRRGDLIRAVHDVPLWGIAQGRVKQVIDDTVNVTQIVLDEEMTMLTGKNYSIRGRLEDNTQVNLGLSTVPGTSKTVNLSPLVPIANAPKVGDLVAFGQTGSETVELLIKEIQPLGGKNARLVCVDHAPAIQDADSGVIPDHNSQITPEQVLTEPFVAQVKSDETVMEIGPTGILEPRIVISLSLTQNIPSNATAIEGRIRPAGTNGRWDWIPPVAPDAREISIRNIMEKEVYDIHLRFKYEDETFSPFSKINNHLVIGGSTPPDDIQNLTLNIIDHSVVLSWDPVTDIDVTNGGRIRVRHSSKTSGATWASAVDIGPEVPPDNTQVTLPLLPGTYLVKAIDLGGNASVNAAAAVSQTGEIPFLHLAVESDESGGGFLGTKTDCSVNATKLEIDLDGNSEVIPLATYDFQGVVDLGNVYENIRLAFEIDAVTFLQSDLIDSEDLVDSPELWDGEDADRANIQMQFHYTEDDPGASPVWSAWQNFLVSDFKARAIQTRMLLISNAVDQNVSVSVLKQHVYLKKRTETKKGLTAQVGGTSFNFDRPFYVEPNFAVLTYDNSSGDTYQITNATNSGFTVQFFDSSQVSIQKSFNYHVEGF